VKAVLAQFRERWPRTQVILRADSGFCRDELMIWCETHSEDYLFGFARNDRLRLLKVAARVTARARRIWVSYSSAYTWQDPFAAAFAASRR
jgi:hypothetical protein